MKTISIINMKGGVGKTTLAVNIAHYIAKKLDKKVLVIDVDPQFNATQCMMNDEDYMEYRKQDRDTICSIFENDFNSFTSTISGSKKQKRKEFPNIKVINIIKNLDLLPGNLDLFKLEMAPGEGRENRLRLYLDTKKDIYDYVIIDTPPTPSVWMTSALIASNYYLIVVKPDPLSMTGIDLLNAIVENRKLNYCLEIKCVGIVLNMIESRTKVFKDACDFLKEKSWCAGLLFKKHIPKRTKIAKEQTSSRFILNLDDSEAKLALTAIVNDLMERINA